MMTDGISLVIATYLLLGLASLAILEAITGRIRKQIGVAAQETQTKLANAGQFTGHTMSMLITLLALWVFWPVAAYGAVEKLLKKSSRQDGTNKEE